MLKVCAVEIPQMLIAKILTEIFELYGCIEEGSRFIVNNAIKLNLFVFDKSFINFVSCVCPITYRGSISYINGKNIKEIVNNKKYEEFVKIVDLIRKNEYNPEVYRNPLINPSTLKQIEEIFARDYSIVKELIGEPSIDNAKRRHFPINGPELMPSLTSVEQFDEVKPIEEYKRGYPMPILMEIKTSNGVKKITVKEICKSIISGFQDYKELKETLSFEILMLREYYKK